jgi:hypothetical protein
VDLSSEGSGCECVTELMTGFDNRENHPEQENVVCQEDTIQYSFGEIGPVRSEYDDGGYEYRKPKQRSEPAE